MVDIKYKGYIFHIEAVGDVYAALFPLYGQEPLCFVRDKNNSGIFKSEMLSYFRTNKALYMLLKGTHPSYRLELDYNNWWECYVTDPHGVFHDLTWATGETDLFYAIDEVLDRLETTIKDLEDAA